MEYTACPLLRGWISRKASTFSLSKSLNEGMSPINNSVAMNNNSNQRAIPLIILQKTQAAILD
jgi:hypothetical protein